MSFNKLLIATALLLILSISVSAVCTISLDKNQHAPLETATAEMVCDNKDEENKVYTVAWINGSDGTWIQNDTGITPKKNIVFYEDFVVPRGYGNNTWLNVSMNGTNLEGDASTTESIQEEGINPGRNRRWSSGYGAKLGDTKSVYVFEDDVDAGKWAFHMNWELKKPTSIIKAFVDERDVWEDDFPGVERPASFGKWLKTPSIPPKDLGEVTLTNNMFFKDLTKKANERHRTT